MDRLVDPTTHRDHSKRIHWWPKIGVLTLVVIVLGLGGPSPAKAQGSSYVPLDDPDLPLFEHLVTRGVLGDPGPFVRPFTRASAIAQLRDARSPHPRDQQLINRLLVRWDTEVATGSYRMDVHGGVQGYGAARRDPLQPTGEGKAAALYAEIGGAVVYGPFVAATRVIAENRLKNDPDWPGSDEQSEKSLAFRGGEAYAGLRFGKLGLEMGVLDRNWGPTGFPGLGVSNAGYPRPSLAINLNTRPVGASFLFMSLPSVETEAGLVQRYYAGHRLTIRPTENLDLTVWETIVLADEANQGSDVVGTFVGVMSFAAQFGREANTNAILGVEGRWRVHPGLQIEGQFAADDIRLGSDNTAAGETPRPDRWAIAVGARGALPAGLSWFARYERVTSLAYRTAVPEENFAADNIGLVRIIPDNDQLTLAVGIPVAGRFLVTPTLSYQRQGEGRLEQPVDFSPETATFLIGTVRRTLRAGVSLAGRAGPFSIRGDIGLNRLSNADHVSGRSRTDPEGRLIMTVGYSHAGTLR